MKVAFTIGSLNRGGTETLLLDTLRQWQSAPFEMMLVHRSGGGLKDELYAAGPDCFELAPRRGRYISYLLQLRKLIRQQHVGVIHAQYWLDALYARVATIGLHIPIVLTFHGYFYKQNTIKNHLMRVTMRIVSQLIFVSNCERTYFVDAYHLSIDKCHVVYNGIDFRKLNSVSKNTLISVLNSSHPKLCMVGSFSYSRAHMVICQALAQMRLPLEFYFIGAKNEQKSHAYQDCYNYCKQHDLLQQVHFVGEQPNVYEWLQQMDGFVYSTKHDTFGIAVIEAMAMGLPVVVNDWEVLKEVAGDEARYFQSDNAEDCANAIRSLLEHLQENKRIAQLVASEVKDTYSIQRYINHLMEIYKL